MTSIIKRAFMSVLFIFASVTLDIAFSGSLQKHVICMNFMKEFCGRKDENPTATDCAKKAIVHYNVNRFAPRCIRRYFNEILISKISFSNIQSPEMFCNNPDLKPIETAEADTAGTSFQPEDQIEQCLAQLENFRDKKGDELLQYAFFYTDLKSHRNEIYARLFLREISRNVSAEVPENSNLTPVNFCTKFVIDQSTASDDNIHNNAYDGDVDYDVSDDDDESDDDEEIDDDDDDDDD